MVDSPDANRHGADSASGRVQPEVVEREVHVYEPTEHIIWLMKRVVHHTQRGVDEAVREFGISAAHVGLLSRLYAEPGVSGAELARQLFVTPQAAQLSLSDLAERGLVERRPDANHGRILRASLTPAGRRVVEQAMAIGLEAEAELLGPLEPGEQAQMREYLQRLMRHLVDGFPGTKAPAAPNGRPAAEG